MRRNISKFFGQLSKVQKEFKLKDTDGVAEYHQRWWEDFITKNAKKYKVKMKPRQLQNLVKRWAFMNKSYSVPQIRTDYKDNPKFLDWILKYDKNNHQAQMKENMKPFEILFFDVGAEIMKNVSGWIAASPERAVQGIKTRLDAVLSGTVKVGNVADEIDDAPVAAPKVDTKPTTTKVETPVVEEDDTLAYFEKLAE